MVDLGLIYINSIINDWPHIMDFEDITDVTSTASLFAMKSSYDSYYKITCIASIKFRGDVSKQAGVFEN